MIQELYFTEKGCTHRQKNIESMVIYIGKKRIAINDNLGIQITDRRNSEVIIIKEK